MTSTENAEATTPIRLATPDDAHAIRALVTEAGLPIDGLADLLDSQLVAVSKGQIVGTAALELYAPYALLRSVAIAVHFRGRGLGASVIAASLKLAKSRDIERVYLLTETASDYFPRFGFVAVPRFRVPERVKTSIEFTKVCPESAIAMELSLV